MVMVVTTGAIRLQISSQIVITNKPTPNFFTDRMPFLLPNQQCQVALRDWRGLFNGPDTYPLIYLPAAWCCTKARLHMSSHAVAVRLRIADDLHQFRHNSRDRDATDGARRVP